MFILPRLSGLLFVILTLSHLPNGYLSMPVESLQVTTNSTLSVNEPSVHVTNVEPIVKSVPASNPPHKFSDPHPNSLPVFFTLPDLAPEQFHTVLMGPIETAIQGAMDKFIPIITHLIPNLYGRDIAKIVGARPITGNESQCSKDFVPVCKALFPKTDELIESLQAKINEELATVLDTNRDLFIKAADDVLKRAQEKAKEFLKAQERPALRSSEVSTIITRVIKDLEPKHTKLKEQVAEVLAKKLPVYLGEVVADDTPAPYKQQIMDSIHGISQTITQEAIVVNLNFKLPGLSQCGQVIYDQLRQGRAN